MTREIGFEKPGRRTPEAPPERDDLWLELLRSAVANLNQALAEAHAAGWTAATRTSSVKGSSLKVGIFLTSNWRRIELD